MATKFIDGIEYDVREGLILMAPVTERGSRVLYRRCLFDGSAIRRADGLPDGKGLTLDGASNIILENCTFRGWMKALTIIRSRGVKVRFCEFTGMRVDGMSANDGSSDLLVGSNYFHDWNDVEANKEHRDAIQMWAISSQPAGTVNATFTDNFIDSGESLWTQSIFVNSNVGPSFAGLTIDGNIIFNAHLHGVSVDGADNPLVIGNRLSTNPVALANTNGTFPAVGDPKVLVRNCVNPVVTGNVENDPTVTENIEAIRAQYRAACGINGTGSLEPIPAPTPAPEPVPEPTPEPTPDADAVELAKARRYRSALVELRAAEADWFNG